MGGGNDLVERVLEQMNKESKNAADSFDRTFREMERLSSLQNQQSYFENDGKGATVVANKKAGQELDNVLLNTDTDGVGPAQEPRRRKKQITDAGRGWYNMERSSHDADFKRDVKIIQLRNYLDPKKFYKRPDKPSKFAQLATVIEGPTEYKSSRLTKKERKNTLLEEVMTDTKIKNYTKRKYQNIQEEKNKVIRFKKRKPLRSKR